MALRGTLLTFLTLCFLMVVSTQTARAHPQITKTIERSAVTTDNSTDITALPIRGSSDTAKALTKVAPTKVHRHLKNAVSKDREETATEQDHSDECPECIEMEGGRCLLCGCQNWWHSWLCHGNGPGDCHLHFGITCTIF